MVISRLFMNSCAMKPFPRATSTGIPHIEVQRACAIIYTKLNGAWLYKRMHATYLLFTMMVNINFEFCAKFGIL